MGSEEPSAASMPADSTDIKETTSLSPLRKFIFAPTRGRAGEEPTGGTFPTADLSLMLPKQKQKVCELPACWREMRGYEL